MESRRKIAKLFGIYFLMFFLGLEIALRITGVMKVYSEKTGFWYRSYWNKKHEGWLHTWTPNTTLDYKQKEFAFTYHINSLGFREKEFSKEKKEGTKRIICIGDSYTEGDGASYEESYPRYLEKMIKDRCNNVEIEIMNAGVAGSDILYVQKFIEHKLLDYNPDAIIVGINSSDVSDLIQRGGLERFKQDGTTQFRKGPWYHIFYKASHVVRLIVREVFNRDRMFVKKVNLPLVHKEMCSIIDQSIRHIREMCKDNNVNIVFFTTPELWMANVADYPHMSLGDLTYEAYFTQNSRLSYMSTLQDADVLNLNMTLLDTLQQLEFESYAWPLNGHFNGKGYALVAKYLDEAIRQFDPNFFCTQNEFN